VLPTGSLGAVLGYAEGATDLVPLGPIARVHPDVFANERIARGHIGTALVAGLFRGVEVLEHANAARRVLVVFGDANDDNNEVAVKQITALRARAKAAHIELVSLAYRMNCFGGDTMLDKYVEASVQTTSRDELAATFESALR
jgi:hypothetical protein